MQAPFGKYLIKIPKNERFSGLSGTQEQRGSRRIADSLVYMGRFQNFGTTGSRMNIGKMPSYENLVFRLPLNLMIDDCLSIIKRQRVRCRWLGSKTANGPNHFSACSPESHITNAT